MTRAMTAPELAALRTSGQRTKLFLAVLKPNTVYTATLDAAPSSNDGVAEITFTGGAGTLADVKAGMTLYVGSTAGAYDLGMCRIRKAPIAGTLYIGEISEIEWDAGGTIYLTVVDDFDLWERPLKLTSGALYADYDVAYSDQHTNFDPVPVLGPHAVVWLTGATVNAQFDASGSWVIGSSISSYAWSAPGSSASSGMATATPTITYNAAGNYRVGCTVTAAKGKSFTAWRYVFVFSAASMPATVFQLKSLQADYETGGWSFGLTMHDEAQLSELRERTLVVLFAKDWHGATEASYGPVTNRENIICVGRVAGESIQWDADAGTVEFMAYGPHYWLRRVNCSTGGLTLDAGANAWNEMPALTVRRAAWHILHWLTTVTRCMDVTLTSDARYTNEALSPAPNPWEQIAELGMRFIFARPGCDRFGAFYLELEPQMVPLASRTWATVMTITENDWSGMIDWKRRPVGETSEINLSGQEFNSSGSGVTRYSLSMGHVKARHGRPEILDRVLTASQSQLNQLAGLLMGWRNNQNPEFTIDFAGGNRFVDLWPRQFCAISIAAGDTERGQAYSGNLIPRTITYTHDEALVPEILFEGETFEQLAVDGDIPVGDGTDISIPDMPPMPKMPLLPPLSGILGGEVSEEEEEIGPRKVLLVSSNLGVLYSENFNEASPNWKFMNSGVTGAQNTIERIIRTPSGALFVLIRANADANGVGGRWVYYASGLGATWTLVKDITGLSGTEPRLVALGYNPNVSEEIAIMTGTSNPAESLGQLFTGTRSGVSAIANNIDADYRLGDISYGMGKWYITHSEANIFDEQCFSRIAAGGSIEKNSINYPLGQIYNASKQRHKRGGGIIYAWNHNGAYLRKIEGNDGEASNTTMPNIGVTEQALPCLIAVDPTGQYLMGGHDGAAGKRSDDYGVSWDSISVLGLGFQVWENCGTPDAWLAGKTQEVKYSGDFGDTWTTKTGDLATVAPLVAVTHLLHIGW